LRSTGKSAPGERKQANNAILKGGIMSETKRTAGTLIIDNVDLELLDHQRIEATNILINPDIHKYALSGQVEALQGIINMLDYWSDVEYAKKHGINTKTWRIG